MPICYTIDRKTEKAYVFKSIKDLKETMIPLAIKTKKPFKVYELMGHGRVLGWIRPTLKGAARFISEQ